MRGDLEGETDEQQRHTGQHHRVVTAVQPALAEPAQTGRDGRERVGLVLHLRDDEFHAPSVPQPPRKSPLPISTPLWRRML